MIASTSTLSAPAKGAALRRILLIDPELAERHALQLQLTREGYQVMAADQLETARRELESTVYDCVLCDLGLSRAGEPDLLAELAGRDPSPLVIVLAEREQAEAALVALRRGAHDVLGKPLRADEVTLALWRAEQLELLRRESRALRQALVQPPPAAPATGLAGMVGKSAVLQVVFRTIQKVAEYKTNVLISGESGTGKELVARALHQLGPRAAGPFVAINCGAIPPSLLESELFGHRRGSFTDAVRDKKGLFEEADTGTLFLDEIGELPLGLQVKLLRALQEEEVRRIGDNLPVKIDVRVIAATMRDLAADVKTGRFREDLYYRLNVMPLRLPPLRERKEDIPLLVDHFLRVYASKHAAAGLRVGSVAPEAMELLYSYSWPGNIRELENTIERAMVLSEGTRIEAAVLEDKIRESRDRIRATLAAGELSIKKTTRILEEDLIRRALEVTGGNRTSAAKILEISHRALLYKIKEYGL